MASSRHERPELFRRVVLDGSSGERELVRDDVPAVMPVAVARPRRTVERPTRSIVRRAIVTRTPV